MDSDKIHSQAEGWLRRAVRMAPHPMPVGRFPAIMQQAMAAGYSRETVLDVLDEWLGYGWVKVVDQVTNDIEVLPAGEDMMVPRPPKEEEYEEKKE